MSLHTGGTVILFTSLVAGSRVGGGVAASVLARRGRTPEHVPTVIFGRHPGHGAPGGGAVPDAVFEGALDGLVAHGSHGGAAAILTGYFASPAQVEAAASFVDAARAANPGVFVLVDPICGDGTPDGSADGLYVKAETAAAVRSLLVPRADLVTPNAYELSFLTGRAIAGPQDAAEAVRSLAVPALVTSVPGTPGALGVLAVTGGEAWITETGRLERVPHGTGDLFAALALAEALDGADLKAVTRIATQRTRAAIRATLEAGARDLVLAASEADALEPVSLRRLGAQRPAWVMGLDGCPAGWAGVLIDLNGIEPPRLVVHDSFRAALAAGERAHVIAVDMPIGFEDAPSGKGGRACERLARMRLGPRRASVFASPLRPALAASSYEEALALNRAAGGPGLSRQTWNIMGRMAEIDAAMGPALEGCVHEVHPELVFAELAGAPMAHAKRTREGRAERLAVLAVHGLPAGLFDPHPFRRKEVAPDDLLDAGACALSAVRIAEGRALCLPEDPPRDARGLRMAIFA
ncbi:DUF429 domain-containing protein [Marinicauda algicola]|uniref:pyridoxal kinase n=1 Tax=Marinicauda algicola TaxID=2029849 RepID=A0A4S2H250_9PROT|nr:PfkB family carbohydrate kinase [Marinicauda algicola]TGY89242.1 DUF429 domain-containing protein [Marinicauda algicola]